MTALPWCLLPALLFGTLAISQRTEPRSWNARRGMTPVFSTNPDAQQSRAPGAQSGGRRHGRHSNRLGHASLSRQPLLPMGGPGDDGMGRGGLRPLKLDVGQGGGDGRAVKMGEGTSPGFRVQSHRAKHRPLKAEAARKDRRLGHHGRRKQGGRRNKARHAKGHFSYLQPSLVQHGDVFEVNPSSVPPPKSPAQPSPHPSPTDTDHSTSPSTSLVTTVKSEQPPTSNPQKSGWRKRQHEVMPTLDMALFDWTDYEDMRPAETWPNYRKKDKWRSKNLSGGNTTVDADTIEPCDHHLDCLSGSCCDLRHHECRPHNRGLNNKCYDDCMCTEGLRCYAKFHRKRRVTRRRGRCVEPESANADQGAFITV
ncbi:draxin-B-like [Anguilla rostrata]|uniref:Dorsal repulsive axon guidance protein n=1 Tax=Anguilla anguilla TaxID=7936 RepID=A0A9D3RQH9_ANGAN|nr:draxin-B-like [Anguilla anguilla]XP_035243900.1 draxin-B-like [Anguilla anguilla]KAG5836052.1 hypothetical protein ANANG_G00250520 [Anguilla anguilla]